MSLGDDANARAAPLTPGFVASASGSVHTLHPGTRLRDQHEITGLIGEGGFGIVYLAYDHALQRRVAIKEYMPAAMASRASGSNEVVVKSERHVETFVLGLRSFVNEARLLARFDHPSLVKVYRFWEENGTAYMVMPYYEGPTLKRALAELARPPDEAELRAWLRPLLDALTAMHAARCYHRDISPDNILITARGPLLLDFGAARRVIGDMTQALTVMLKPGYAPIEQYGEMSTMAQGAWTDLYALACVVYFAIMGKPPMSSVERLMGDALEPLGQVAADRYTAPFLQAIDAALALRPQHRPQSVAELRDLLDGRSSRSTPAAGFAATTPSLLDPVVEVPAVPPRIAGASASASASAAAPALVAPPEPPPADRIEVTLMPRSETMAEPHPPGRMRRRGLVAAASVTALLIALGGAYQALRPAPEPTDTTPEPLPEVAPQSAPQSAPQTAPGTAPSDTPAAAVTTPAPVDAAATARTTRPGATPVPMRQPAQTATSAAPAQRTQPKPAVAADTTPPTPTPSSRPAPSSAATASSTCSDILQKASLEPLTAIEAAFLKKECR